MPPKPKRPTNDGPVRKRPRAAKLPEPPPASAEVQPPAPPVPAPASPPAPTSRWTVGTSLLVVLVALVVVLALIGVLRLRGGDEGFRLDLDVPTEASAADVREYATARRPVYWIGPPATGKLELWRTARGIYVRYLPDGVPLGTESPRYTTIATYPQKGAYSSIQRKARSGTFTSARLEGGGIAGWNRSPGTSVYIAYPRRNYVIEVYDVSPLRARSLAIGGRVEQVP